jgi:adenine-specific DNA-methyltransferase
VRKLDTQLSADLEAEFVALTKRRTFGLVFEQHHPEAVELPERSVRRGDKVRVLPPRGKSSPRDKRLWRVTKVEHLDGHPNAHLVELNAEDPESQTASVEDLVVVAEFRDRIYPGLIETGRVERGGDKPFHTVINAENFHALELLTYTHRHSIDAIYIDPPYNTGARDWKYNNDYVESDDDYRHSKWLAFMERRLRIARELLNPDNSVLIVTIDEKEYLRLGLLLEQTFPEAKVQMVSVVINPSGTSRELLSRVDEYAFFAFFGSATPARLSDNMLTGEELDTRDTGLPWESLLRRGNSWYRTQRPNLCYPVLIDRDSGEIMGVGAPFEGDDEASRPTTINGFDAAWPVRTDGRLGIWRKDGPGLIELARSGFAYASAPDLKRGTWSIKYLMSGTVAAINSGELIVERSGNRGEVVGRSVRSRSVAKTVWNRARHNAGMHGSALLRSFIPGRTFPFPKSLYAVEDAIQIAVGDKKDAVVLDAHAVMRLNRQDGGRRQCISVTNNEVSADEQVKLRGQGLRPGDSKWEELGICDYITKPRITAAITGKTPEGDPVKGDYRFTDEFPMSEGFDENAAYFTMTYEAPLSVQHHRAFERVAPILWLRAGSQGRIITELGDRGWDVAETYAVLENLDQADAFAAAVANAESVGLAFIITDDDSAFQMVCRELPETVTPVQLYESYLQNFEINIGRSL